MKKIGGRLRHYRTEKGLTQGELGKMINVSAQAISQWEREINNIDNETILKLCRALEISSDTLLGVNDNPAPTLSIDELVVPDTDDITRRYYELDDHGKDVVRTILEKEYDRVMQDRASFVTIYPMFDVNVNDQHVVERINVDFYPQAAGMGFGQDVDVSVPEKLELNKDIVPDHTDFIIRVTGDSMEPTFYAGDMLFVERTKVLRPGDIGVFNLNGEALVKEYGENELISHNKKYEPIRALDGCYIQGRILGKVNE